MAKGSGGLATRRPVVTEPASERTSVAFSSIEAALTRLLRLAEPRSHAGTEPLLLDRAGYAVLVRLAECGPARLTELAGMLDIDISTASRHVRALEERNFIERADDPDDQRARRLGVSRTGSAAIELTRAARLAHLESKLDDWDEADLDELGRLLGQFVASLGRHRDRDRDEPQHHEGHNGAERYGVELASRRDGGR